MKLEAHVQRVVNEKEDLDEKRKLLDGFINSKKITEVSAHHQNLLIQQANAMAAYSEALGMRLEDFGVTQ